MVGATPFVVCRSANSMVRGPAANAFVPHRSFLVSSGARLLACSLACFLPQLHGQYTTCEPPLGSARETAPLEWRARPASQARGFESHCHSCSRAYDEASILGHRTHLWLELLRGFSLKGAKELLSCPPYGCVSARVGCTTGNTGIRGHGSAQAILRWGWVQ